MPPKKIGRPNSDNPKSVRIDVRLTKEELEIVDKYCDKKKVSRPQALRDGIKSLNEQ